jgi:hypothetical protein
MPPHLDLPSTIRYSQAWPLSHASGIDITRNPGRKKPNRPPMLKNFFVDRFAIFYDYFKVDGWVITDSPVEKIVLSSPYILAGKIEHDLPSPDLGDAAENGRFSGSYLVRKGFHPLEASIIVYEAGEPPREITHKDMADRINIIQKPKAIDEQFIEMTRAPEYTRLVEIGSRNRSGIIRNDIFDG